MANPNPPKAPNQTGKTYKTHVQNPKALLFASFYLTPSSKTFMNVYQSGLQAGYSDLYSRNITVQQPKWWKELMETSEYKRARMLNAAEQALEQAVTDQSKDKDDKKIKHDAAKFISERLGKEHYSTRQELTGADGRRLFTNETRSNANIPLKSLFKGVEQPK
jgi:hypothetical protein